MPDAETLLTCFIAGLLGGLIAYQIGYKHGYVKGYTDGLSWSIKRTREIFSAFANKENTQP